MNSYDPFTGTSTKWNCLLLLCNHSAGWTSNAILLLKRLKNANPTHADYQHENLKIIVSLTSSPKLPARKDRQESKSKQLSRRQRTPLTTLFSAAVLAPRRHKRRHSDIGNGATCSARMQLRRLGGNKCSEGSSSRMKGRREWECGCVFSIVWTGYYEEGFFLLCEWG